MASPLSGEKPGLARPALAAADVGMREGEGDPIRLRKRNGIGVEFDVGQTLAFEDGPNVHIEAVGYDHEIIPAFPAEDYPKVSQPEGIHSISFSPEILLEGINRTLFAAGDEELRPVMNGIFFDLKTDATNLVASDSHKLVCYTRTDIKALEDSSFILPKKPANILKNLLVRAEEDVTISYDNTNAFFTFGTYSMACRLVEGNYPAYRSVIPQNNPNNIIADRLELMNAVRRISVCANQATNLIRLLFSGNQIFVSAQDIEFRIAAQERLSCQYDGPAIEMGFKSLFLAEILANLPGTEVNIALSDPSRVGLITPLTTDSEFEETCALIMPMMITQ